MGLIFLRQALDNLVAASNSGVHILHASVGLWINRCLCFFLQGFQSRILSQFEQFGNGGIFLMVHLHLQDPHHKRQGQPGHHKGKEQNRNHHHDSVFAHLFHTVDHGNRERKNQGH